MDLLCTHEKLTGFPTVVRKDVKTEQAQCGKEASALMVISHTMVCHWVQVNRFSYYFATELLLGAAQLSSWWKGGPDSIVSTLQKVINKLCFNTMLEMKKGRGLETMWDRNTRSVGTKRSDGETKHHGANTPPVWNLLKGSQGRPWGDLLSVVQGDGSRMCRWKLQRNTFQLV